MQWGEMGEIRVRLSAHLHGDYDDVHVKKELLESESTTIGRTTHSVA